MALLRKKSGTFNQYTMDISYGELVALENALSDNHSGPVADELYATIRWYLDGNVEKPGEDESEKDKEKEIEKGEGKPEAEDLEGFEVPKPELGGEDNLDLQLPAPPEGEEEELSLEAPSPEETELGVREESLDEWLQSEQDSVRTRLSEKKDKEGFKWKNPGLEKALAKKKASEKDCEGEDKEMKETLESALEDLALDEKEAELGSGSRFKKVEKEAAKGGAKDPKAVAAAIGIKKYGKAKMEKMAVAGKK